MCVSVAEASVPPATPYSIDKTSGNFPFVFQPLSLHFPFLPLQLPEKRSKTQALGDSAHFPRERPGDSFPGARLWRPAAGPDAQRGAC